MAERDVQIEILAKSIFWNRLKYGLGELLANLYKLDIQQEEHFNHDDREELIPGVFEKKVVEEFNRCYTAVLIEVLREFSDIYHRDRRQDFRVYWESVKKAIFELCKDEESLEKVFVPYLRSLHFGNFKGVKVLSHSDYRTVVIDWIQELRGKAHYLALSSASERKMLLTPDVVVVLGSPLEEEMTKEEQEHFHDKFQAIKNPVKRVSENLATIDILDNHLSVAEENRKGVVNRWLDQALLFVVDLSDSSPAAYCAFGYRTAMKSDVIALCLRSKWDESKHALLQWPVMIYDSLEDLDQRFSLQICDLFDKYEFTGDAEIIL